MKLFAAAIQHYGTELPFDEITHVEFYWAEDDAHAVEQAEDANEGCDIVVREVVPQVAEVSQMSNEQLEREIAFAVAADDPHPNAQPWIDRLRSELRSRT